MHWFVWPFKLSVALSICEDIRVGYLRLTQCSQPFLGLRCSSPSVQLWQRASLVAWKVDSLVLKTFKDKTEKTQIGKKFKKKRKDEAHPGCSFSCHESFIHFNTVGLGLGDECIFMRKAAKMLCWNFPPWIFCEGKHTTPLAGVLPWFTFEETQTWIHPRRWLDHPDSSLSQTVFCLHVAWSTKAVKQLGGGEVRVCERQCDGRVPLEVIVEQHLSIQ